MLGLLQTLKQTSHWYPFTGVETFLFINLLIDNGLLQTRPDCDQTLLHLKHIVHRLWYIHAAVPSLNTVLVALFEECG